MVDSVLWAKSNGNHRRSGDNLLCASNALQMMATSGSRTRPMHSPDNGNVSLEDVDVIDLDGLNLDEEDGWLYRLTEPPKDSPSPYTWVRTDFDLNDVGTPRGFLLQTLEQATRKTASRFHSSRFCNTVLSPSDSTDALSKILDNSRPTKKDAVCNTLDFGCSTENGNTINTVNNGGVVKPETVGNTLSNDDVASPETVCNTLNNDGVTRPETVCKTLNNDGVTSPETLCNAVDNSNVADKVDLSNVPDCSQTTPAKSKGRYEIDTRTFTRPKKSAKNSSKINIDNSVVDAVGDTAECVSPEAKLTPAVEDSVMDEHFLKLEDVTDVQVLARMQEDSLRQSYSSPLGYTPKSQRRALASSTGRLNQVVSNSSLSYHSNVSSPGLCHDDPLGITKSTHSLSSASSESSTSHSDSFTNANPSQVQGPRGFSETHQHSLPNLVKAAKFSVPRSVPSDSKLYTSPTSRSLPVSAPGSAKSRAIPNSKKACAPEQPDTSSVPTADPTPVPARPKSALPTPKPVSGIPKPSATSRLRQPANWKKNLTMPTQNDGSWREGCF